MSSDATTPATAPPTASLATTQPHSKTELFLTFNSIALQGFGGVLTIIQREMVDKRRWMTQHEFVEDWAVAQVLPGGNVINLCIILGNRYFGWRGALVALAGLMAAPMVIVLVLGTLYTQYSQVQAISGAVRGMGAAAAGLIGAAAIKMLYGLKNNILGKSICAALIVLTVAAIGYMRLPLITTVLGLGLPAFAYAWVMVRRAEQRAALAALGKADTQ
jgi:chromate transporter